MADTGGELTLGALGRELAQAKVRPAYLIVGDELLLRREACAAIEAAVLGDEPTARALGRQVFAGGEARIGEILAAAGGLPMFGGRRLIVVDGVERLRKGDREALPAALRGLPVSTVMVLIADKLDNRLTFTRDLQRLATVIPTTALPERELPEWITRRFTALGHALERGAADQLLLLAGAQLSALAGEIEKISLYVGESRKVTREDVNRVVAGGIGGTLDDLTHAVGERNLAGALAALANALEAGEEPIRIVGFLAYRIRELTRAASGGGGGWVRPQSRHQARNYTPFELARSMAALYAADRELKGGGIGAISLRERRRGQLVLERLLVQIVDSSRPAAPAASPRAVAGSHRSAN
jgi:DNA polymerase-3 subunit delta